MSDFDRWIGDQLKDHSAKRPQDAWERFSQQWPEGQSREDKAFERFLQDRLHHHQVHHTEAARSTHWQTLRLAMDRLRDRTREIFLAKGLELSLVFLICFYGWPVTNTDLEPSSPVPFIQEGQMPPERAGLASDDEVIASLGSESGKRSGEAQLTNSNFEFLGTAAHGTQNIVPPTGPTIPLSPEKETFPPTQELALVPITNSNNYGVIQPDLTAPALNIEKVSQPSMMHLTQVPSLAISQVDKLHEVLLPTPFRNNEKRFFHKLHMAFNVDAHYIVTPYDHLLTKRGYDQLVGGYGAAIGYSWEGQKWGLRAQVGFRHMNYLPKPYTEVFDGDVQRGYFTETLRNIDLNLLSGSLYATRYLTHGKWRWYALTGGTMQVAFLANYDRKQRYLPGADPVTPGGTPEPQNPSLTSQKKYADGIFEGGNLEENYYITLDFGAGLERHINGRISVFAEPVYHHNPFKRSLGPNSDRINTLSMYTGVRILL